MSLREIPCPICGEHRYKILYHPWRTVTDPVKLFGAAAGELGTQQIVRCETPDCGLIYANPQYDEATILSGYAHTNDSGHDTQFESRVKTFLASLKKHRKVIPPPGSRILDVGCAGGAYVKAADLYGYRSFGLEPSNYLTKQAQDRGLQVTCGTLDTYQPTELFDMISLWDVLEHVTDPRKTLKDCSKLLKKDGVLLVNYPDVGTWQAKLAGKSFWWFLSVHLWYFDRHSIKKLLEQEGYQVYSVRPHFQRLMFGYLLDVARIYSPTLASVAGSIIPSFLKNLLVMYYASQTTVLARKTA